MKTLQDITLGDLLPDSISSDQQVKQSAEAIDPELKTVSGFLCALGMSELYRVKVPKCGRWRQAHSQRQGLNREVPTEGSPRQTIDLTNRNGLRHKLSGKTA